MFADTEIEKLEDILYELQERNFHNERRIHIYEQMKKRTSEEVDQLDRTMNLALNDSASKYTALVNRGNTDLLHMQQVRISIHH